MVDVKSSFVWKTYIYTHIFIFTLFTMSTNAGIPNVWMWSLTTKPFLWDCDSKAFSSSRETHGILFRFKRQSTTNVIILHVKRPSRMVSSVSLTNLMQNSRNVVQKWPTRVIWNFAKSCWLAWNHLASFGIILFFLQNYVHLPSA